jgi:hypothetical protein
MEAARGPGEKCPPPPAVTANVVTPDACFIHYTDSVQVTLVELKQRFSLSDLPITADSAWKIHGDSVSRYRHNSYAQSRARADRTQSSTSLCPGRKKK